MLAFANAGQEAAVKEAFPFTKYGTIDSKVIHVSHDAIQDEKRGLIYSTRVQLAKATMQVEGTLINLTPGMAVTVEAKTASRRVIEYFLSPLMNTGMKASEKGSPMDNRTQSKSTHLVYGQAPIRTGRLAQLLAALLFTVLAGCGSAGESRPDSKIRLAQAEARFAERCKTSGEFIKRTVDNVEGVYLLKLRPKRVNYGAQFEMNDPYGNDFTGEAYIRSFLRGHFQAETSGVPVAGSPLRIGYRYVEAIDPLDGKRDRYTGSVKEVLHTSSILIGGGWKDCL